MSLESKSPARNPEDSLERRKRLRKQYRELYNDIAALLFRHDPMGINFESNRDEYEPEVDTILPRLSKCQSVEDVNRVVHQEFIRWFGDIAGPQERYTKVAGEIWDLWQRSLAASSGHQD